MATIKAIIPEMKKRLRVDRFMRKCVNKKMRRTFGSLCSLVTLGWLGSLRTLGTGALKLKGKNEKISKIVRIP